MLLSIIVPVYNVENYIERCINSLINQDLKEDYEILVVDDGSKDNSINIVKSIKNEKIKILTKENGGLSSARNYGINHAVGKYITFVDSDDYVDLNLFSKCIKKMEKEELDMLGYDFMIVRGRNEVPINRVKKYDDKTNFVLNNPNACNKVFLRKIFIDNSIKFDEGIWYEDLALIPSLYKYAKKVGYCEDVYYYYIQRENSITNIKKYNQKCLDIIKSINLIASRIDDADYRNYLISNHLIYLGSLRTVEFNKKDEFKKIVKFVETQHPDYLNTKYFNDIPKLKRVYIKAFPNYNLCKVLNYMSLVYKKFKED